jgi:hypothetical protein
MSDQCGRSHKLKRPRGGRRAKDRRTTNTGPAGAAGGENGATRKRWRHTAVLGRCAHPLAPAHAPDALGGNGVIAALTARPRVDGIRDPARHPPPEARPETLAEPGGLGRPFARLGARENRRDGGAITVPVERSRVFFHHVTHAARPHLRQNISSDSRPYNRVNLDPGIVDSAISWAHAGPARCSPANAGGADASGGGGPGPASA